MSKRNFRFYIREYFTFSRSERNGVIVLLILISISLILKYLIPHIISQKSPIDVSKFESEIARFEQSCDSVRNIPITVQAKTNLHNFPMPDVSRQDESKYIVEINTADSIALDKIPGIGPVFAQRIIKYRCILKGFYSLNQLNEVYGLKPEIIRNIENHLVIDTSKVQKIDINTVSFKEINAHPYISYEQTKAICRMRSKQKIKSLMQLTEKKIFSVNELEKVRPYLVIY